MSRCADRSGAELKVARETWKNCSKGGKGPWNNESKISEERDERSEIPHEGVKRKREEGVMNSYRKNERAARICFTARDERAVGCLV